MRYYAQGRAKGQVQCARKKLLEQPNVCFEKLLPRQQVCDLVKHHGVHFRERLYTPLLTLWTFLYQVLSADQSCRAAVARLLAALSLGDGDMVCSAQTGAYCKARQRLPESVLSDLTRQSGQALHARVPSRQLLQGHPVKIADGTTVSMPDTPANQKAYPQMPGQKPGVGFPIMRLVGLMILSCAAVLDVAMGPYQGKRTGETALLRQMMEALRAGDILLADACFANYWTVAQLRQRDVDIVTHHDGKRRIDFRQGRRLGRRDHIAIWHKPARPAWMSAAMYARLPETLHIREVMVRVHQRGFRVQSLVVTTTLLDDGCYTASDLAAAYHARWHVELDMRSIKQVMEMDVLRCKTPEMVRKEVWMHLLAYNLVRKLAAEAAATVAGTAPREISFKGTLQTLTAFAAVGWTGLHARPEAFYTMILQAVATHHVGHRPNRIEPRAVKRRPKEQNYLKEPRAIARKRLTERS